jgi:hypothetical protein
MALCDHTLAVFSCTTLLKLEPRPLGAVHAALEGALRVWQAVRPKSGRPGGFCNARVHTAVIPRLDLGNRQTNRYSQRRSIENRGELRTHLLGEATEIA